MDELFLLSFLLTIILGLIVWKKNQNSQTSNIKLPQPPKLPFIGNLHQLVCPLPQRRLAELAKTYGPLMQVQLGQVTAVVVSSAEIAKQVLKDNDIKVSDRCRASVTDIIFYNRQDVAFTPYGEYWRQMRKICILELLSSKRVQSFRSIREEEMSDFITSIHSKIGSQINLSHMMFTLTNTIAARTAIGRKNRSNQEAMLKLISLFLRAMGGFTVLDLFPSLRFVHIFTRMKSNLLKLHKQADQLFEDIIKEHKQELKLGGDQTQASNLLSVLLQIKANDPDSLLTNDGIKALTLQMMMGATDTSGVVLEWAMSELMKNPKVMKKAQEEVRKVYVENGKLDESVINDLKFLKATIKETLRLHPPATLLPRLCREEFEINGYNIKPKTEVLVNIWAIARDPNLWIEPDKFCPERFIDSEVDYKGCNFEFLPFGTGRRICPGILLGIASVELTLAKLLCDFDWELPNQMKPEELDMDETFSIAIARKNQLYLIPVAPRYPVRMN